MIEYFIFDTQTDFIALEKNIYENFYVRTPDKWIMENYVKTAENRAKPYFDYKELLCYGSKEDNEIISGSIFYSGQKNLQLEKIGFILPEWIKNKKYCEGILFFQNKCKYHPGYIMENFGNYFVSELKKYGYEIFLGTCYEDLLKLYIRAGFEVVFERNNIEEEKKEYLIVKNIK